MKVSRDKQESGRKKGKRDEKHSPPPFLCWVEGHSLARHGKHRKYHNHNKPQAAWHTHTHTNKLQYSKRDLLAFHGHTATLKPPAVTDSLGETTYRKTINPACSRVNDTDVKTTSTD